MGNAEKWCRARRRSPFGCPRRSAPRKCQAEPFRRGLSPRPASPATQVAFARALIYATAGRPSNGGKEGASDGSSPEPCRRQAW